MKNKKNTSFYCLVDLICKTSLKKYIIIVGSLIIIGGTCNYSSNRSLPMFWVLVAGFALVIYMDVHSIKQSGVFIKSIKQKIFNTSKKEPLRYTKKSAQPNVYKGYAVLASKLEIINLFFPSPITIK